MLSKYVRKKTIAIQRRDLVEMKGIVVGRNYRNNKCIVQLIKPALCVSDTVVKNGQKIEIDEKFIRKITITTTDQAALAPTLDPETVSLTQRDSAMTAAASSVPVEDDRAPSWDVLMEDWRDIIGDGDVRSIEIDASESCDSWTIGDCDSCRRVEFCLSYYKLWIGHKVDTQNGSNIDKFAADLFRHEFLSDFLAALAIRGDHYSPAMLLNDFHHIKQFHIDNNQGHNHSMDGEVCTSVLCKDDAMIKLASDFSTFCRFKLDDRL